MPSRLVLWDSPDRNGSTRVLAPRRGPPELLGRPKPRNGGRQGRRHGTRETSIRVQHPAGTSKVVGALGTRTDVGLGSTPSPKVYMQQAQGSDTEGTWSRFWKKRPRREQPLSLHDTPDRDGRAPNLQSPKRPQESTSALQWARGQSSVSRAVDRPVSPLTEIPDKMFPTPHEETSPKSPETGVLLVRDSCPPRPQPGSGTAGTRRRGRDAACRPPVPRLEEKTRE